RHPAALPKRRAEEPWSGAAASPHPPRSSRPRAGLIGHEVQGWRYEVTALTSSLQPSTHHPPDQRTLSYPPGAFLTPSRAGGRVFHGQSGWPCCVAASYVITE